jgi:3-hydroxyisobutyrate dehydrogenase
MQKIGFIGLGNMGAKMVMHLLKANYEVIGYDVNEDSVDQLLSKGLIKAYDLKEISKNADIIITMLPNGTIVEEVFDSIVNNLKPGTLFTDCSTIDVDKAIELYNKCNIKDLLFLDAPVSGGVGGAEDGTLTFMVGGKTDAYNIMLPLFEVMGKKSLLCGSSGSGQATKACNNMLLAITMIGVGEAFNLGSNLGLDSEKLFEILSTSTGSCWAINSYCPIESVGPKSPADNHFQPGFSVDLMYKDLSIALKSIQRTRTSAPFGKKPKKTLKNG